MDYYVINGIWLCVYEHMCMYACIVMLDVDVDVDVSIYKFLYGMLSHKNFDNYSNTINNN